MRDMGITRIGVVTGNTGFGGAGKKQLESMAADHGIEIAISEVYDKAAADLTDILTKVQAAEVEAVVNWSIVPAQAIVPKNMRQIGLDVPLFQSHGFGNIKYVEQAGEAAEGILFPCGRLLVADVLPAYDAMLIVTEGLKAAGEVDRAALRDAIEGLTGLVGTAGIFNFSPEDHNGLDLDAFEMLTVQDGRFVLYEKD
jgi:branched-chain amino acid transport system substrate-binding protein